MRSAKQDQIHASIVSTLLALMDGLDSRGAVVVIGATNRPDAIDPALRRPGRFDRELVFTLPTRVARREILSIHTRAWPPACAPPPALIDELATRTVGYCGADLKALCTEATLAAMRRRYPQLYESERKLAIDTDSIAIEPSDFGAALQRIVPAAHRSASSHAAPLAMHLRPLLEPLLESCVERLRSIFPPLDAVLANDEESSGAAPGGASADACAAAAVAGSAAAAAVQTLLPGASAASADGALDGGDQLRLLQALSLIHI